jgi:molybdopterin-synthase adenylyltransferase
METDARWRDQLLRDVAGAGLLRHPRRTDLNNGTLGLEGEITIAGRAVTVALVVDSLLQNRLPHVYLRPSDALGFIPHVDPGGQICFLDQEGIVLDQRRQLDIVRACVEQVRRTLEDGVSGTNHADFVDEFEVYWQRLGGIIALSSLEPADEVAEVAVGVGPDPQAPLRLAGDARGIAHITDEQRRSGPWTAHRAIYLPLEPGTLLMPPQAGQPFWTLDDVRALLKFCSAANYARLSDLVARPARDPEAVLFHLPRPSGGAALFGIRFTGTGQRHPLAEGGGAARLTPITIIRRDRSFLVQRGGGRVELDEKRVLLLGCGSVGGHLAFELARAGGGNLALVDHDILTPENTYRHVLGKRYWWRTKPARCGMRSRRSFPSRRWMRFPRPSKQRLLAAWFS